MIGLAITFTAGRFHATPWDRSVNEGEVEWPPSPWRLLRALVAAFHLLGERDFAGLTRLCDRLASAPRFLLPPATSSHTRHYMPQGKANVTGLVLDAFVAFRDRKAVAYVIWDDATLATDERRLLERLVVGIGYLGRAESWCAVTVVDHALSPDLDRVAVDLVSRGGKADSGPIVRRLGVDSNARGRGLQDALSETTDAMRKRRFVVPDGSTWLEYRFPSDYGRDRIAAIRATSRQKLPRRVLRFRLEGSSPNLLPSVTETLVVGDVFRLAVMSIQGRRGDTQNTPVFTGKDHDGKPLTGENHAYFLPRDLDGDGLLDTVDVYIPRAFSHEEYRALASVSRLYANVFKLAADDYIRVTLLGDAPQDSARRWRSASPFVLPRFEKVRGAADDRRIVDSVDEQIRRELAHRSLSVAEVQVDRGAAARIALRGGRSTFAGSYRRLRKGDGTVREAVTATLTFDEPVQGPIAIGRYAHFGLGQFVPIDDGV